MKMVNMMKYCNSIPNILVHNVDVQAYQGIPGKDGYTPYIDPNTRHWFINGIDTGVSASGDNNFFRVATKYDLPSVSPANRLYLVEDSFELYSWDSSLLQFSKITGLPKIEYIICGTTIN